MAFYISFARDIPQQEIQILGVMEMSRAEADLKSSIYKKLKTISKTGYTVIDVSRTSARISGTERGQRLFNEYITEVLAESGQQGKDPAIILGVSDIIQQTGGLYEIQDLLNPKYLPDDIADRVELLEDMYYKLFSVEKVYVVPRIPVYNLGDVLESLPEGAQEIPDFWDD